MLSTIDKIFHNHYLISTDCYYTRLNQTVKYTTLLH